MAILPQIMTLTMISKVIFGIFLLNILLHETIAEEKKRDEKFCMIFKKLIAIFLKIIYLFAKILYLFLQYQCSILSAFPMMLVM